MHFACRVVIENDTYEEATVVKVGDLVGLFLSVW